MEESMKATGTIVFGVASLTLGLHAAAGHAQDAASYPT
jgi:hypothetical protein